MGVAGYEVVVVGGGVMGSSIAYHVARQGRRVLVVERAEPAVEPSASWASAGGVRRQGRHPAEAKLAIEAIARWLTLEQELEADLHYRRAGNLYLGEGDDEAERVAAFVRTQIANGFADVRLLDRKECLEVVPGLNDAVSAGSYSPSDGQADPGLTTRALAAAARRNGAEYWNATESLGVVMWGGRAVGLRTSRGEVEADHVVLAAGAWTDELAAGAGFRLPIRPTALQILISTPAPPRTLRPVLGSAGRALSLKQLPSGEFMLGGGWQGDVAPDRRSYSMRQASIDGSWATASGLLPAVGRQSLARRWCGIEAKSIDEIPFIGPIPGVERLTVAAGFTGHGFAIASAVGRAVADQLVGKPTPELEGLSPSRAAMFDPLEVDQFLADPTASGLVAG